MTSAATVQKLWNYCNVLRDDGMSHGDYAEQLATTKEAMPGAADTGKRGEVKTALQTTQKTTQKIIALIRQNPEITRQELAMELEITDSGIKYHLKKMQDKGLLHRAGPDKGGYWEVVEPLI
jgi:predicted HTH transcriptional regulator